GIYNICDSGETNWYGFAIEIFRVAKDLGYKLQVEDVLGIPTSAYPTPAERPRNSRMNCSKISSKLGIVPPVWQNNLSLFLYEVSLKLK
ncbi:MAG: dTDP-4-dehydrorhamnose reductase, partial [Proteobacteria bacterium]